MAATAVTGASREPALQIALAHFLFNAFAVDRRLRRAVATAAAAPGRRLDRGAGAERKGLALAYVLAVFFAVPALLTVATLRLF